MICNNRDKCGNGNNCIHGISHENEYTLPHYMVPDLKSKYIHCTKSNCNGHYCSLNCGTPRKCIPEFMDLVKTAIKEGE